MSKHIVLRVFDPILTKLLKKFGGGDRRKFQDFPQTKGWAPHNGTPPALRILLFRAGLGEARGHSWEALAGYNYMLHVFVDC